MRRDPGTAVHGGDGPARANADAFIARPNPIITGWVAHYRIGVSKHAFGTLNAHLLRLTGKWAR
jgi:RNA-directed DNA polymerase